MCVCPKISQGFRVTRVQLWKKVKNNIRTSRARSSVGVSTMSARLGTFCLAFYYTHTSVEFSFVRLLFVICYISLNGMAMVLAFALDWSHEQPFAMMWINMRAHTPPAVQAGRWKVRYRSMTPRLCCKWQSGRHLRARSCSVGARRVDGHLRTYLTELWWTIDGYVRAYLTELWWDG